MNKRQKLFLFSCAALLILSLAAISVVSNVALAQPASGTPVQVQATLIPYSLSDIGKQIIDIRSLPAAQFQQLSRSAISKDVALANARPYASLDTNQPSSVDAILALFIDTELSSRDASGQMVL